MADVLSASDLNSESTLLDLGVMETPSIAGYAFRGIETTGVWPSVSDINVRNLTATKILTGELRATLRITTGAIYVPDETSTPRLQITSDGLAFYNSGGDIALSADISSGGPRLLVKGAGALTSFVLIEDENNEDARIELWPAEALGADYGPALVQMVTDSNAYPTGYAGDSLLKLTGETYINLALTDVYAAALLLGFSDSASTTTLVDLLAPTQSGVTPVAQQIRFRTGVGAPIRAAISSTLDGILFGSSGDTNLYRSAADTLKTDDNFSVAGNLTVAGLFPGLKNIQVLTSTAGGTWNKPTGTTMIIVECIGGGGGGGGCAATSTTGGAGGGGGGGGYAMFFTTSPAASYTWDVGTGGGGGAAGNNNGSAGGDTIWGTAGAQATAKGGSGGVGSGSTGGDANGGNGGAGGATGNGTITEGGGPGEQGIIWDASTAGGSGGDASHGGGGGVGGLVAGSSSGGNTGRNYGGGGSGGNAHNTATSAAGGNGAPGVIIVYEFGT